MSLADSSMSTIADASSGSRNPAASPTATQLRFQNVCRCPERIAILRAGRSRAAGPMYARSSRSAASSEMWRLE
jgi:hypothetical protein